jgi:thioredoxin reductase (NADPH)
MSSSITHESALIAGAGPIGLACAISAQRSGIDPLVIDAGAVCNSIVHYPTGMVFFTTPERLEIGRHPLVCAAQKPTREEALKYYRGVVRTQSIRVQTYTQLLNAEGRGDGIRCHLDTRLGSRQLACDRLVLATGYFDHANLLGIPGEDLPHVSHYFREAHRDYGLKVAVIGGKNSAVEAALELFRAGADVTLIYRGSEFKQSVKYWLRPDIQNRIKAGEIAARFGAQMLAIDAEHVTIRRADGEEEWIRADRVYALTGYHPDLELFERIGIELDDKGRPTLDPETLETNVPGIYMAGSVTRGRHISDVFIENGRFDGEKIFGDANARAVAKQMYGEMNRYYGE